MTKYDKFSCITCKIMAVMIILISIGFTPSYYYIGLLHSIGQLLASLLVSAAFFAVGWPFLLKTNNPLTRYNIFTINLKWKSKMEYSMEEKPGQLYEFDKPDESDVRQRKRNKTIDKILK